MEKQACGPEARALRGKSIGGKRIRLGDPPVLPQDGRAQRAPLQHNNLVFEGRTAARPTQEMKRALWFLRAIPPKAGLPGRGTPEIQFIFCLLGEKLRWARPILATISFADFISKSTSGLAFFWIKTSIKGEPHNHEHQSADRPGQDIDDGSMLALKDHYSFP